MYNGIGLTTARGSGTSGYVQKNLSSINKQKKHVDYRTEEDIKRMEAALNRPPNQDILTHQRKRQIEVKCLEEREKLETQGFSEEEIENKIAILRKELQQKQEEQAKVKNAFMQFDDSGRPLVKETHQMAELNNERNDRLKNALGLSKNFVEGTSFNYEMRAKEKALDQADKEGKQRAFEEEQERRRKEREEYREKRALEELAKKEAKEIEERKDALLRAEAAALKALSQRTDDVAPRVSTGLSSVIVKSNHYKENEKVDNAKRKRDHSSDSDSSSSSSSSNDDEKNRKKKAKGKRDHSSDSDSSSSSSSSDDDEKSRKKQAKRKRDHSSDSDSSSSSSSSDDDEKSRKEKDHKKVNHSRMSAKKRDRSSSSSSSRRRSRNRRSRQRTPKQDERRRSRSQKRSSPPSRYRDNRRSPTFRDRRRITSARKKPTPYRSQPTSLSTNSSDSESSSILSCNFLQPRSTSMSPVYRLRRISSCSPQIYSQIAEPNNRIKM